MYGGGAPAVTPLTKDQYALAHLRRRRRGRLSRYGTAIALRIKQFRSQSDDAVSHSQHGSAPIWAVHEDTPSPCMMGMMD